jgi:hypothetical protein
MNSKQCLGKKEFNMSHPLFELLKRLDETHIYYTLSRHRDDTVMVTITLVGERVEAEVFDDGHMEVARFLGTEDILGGKEVVENLIERTIKWDKST